MKRTLFILALCFSSLVWGVSEDNPPAELDQLYSLISESDRMSITINTENGESEIFASSSLDDILSFVESLVLKQPEKGEWFHCMCNGSPAIYFFKGTNEAIRLTNHHGRSIRCALWYSDVSIKDVDKWVSWFDSHGITSVRREVERLKKGEEEWRQQKWDKWYAATPKPIQSLLNSPTQMINQVNVSLSLLSETLEKEMTNKNQRILALLEWYGSGDGHWIEYPQYEDNAEHLLLMYPTKDILNTISSIESSNSLSEGCSRFFCGDKFNQSRPNEMDELPSSLRIQLWKYVVRSDYQWEKRRKAYRLVDIPFSKSQGSKLIEGSWIFETNGSEITFNEDGTIHIEKPDEFPINTKDKTWEYIGIGRLSFGNSSGSANYNLLRLNSNYLEILDGSKVLKLKRE